MAKNKDDGKLLYCSFCGKSQNEVKKLIAGPSVFICDECVDLCIDIIREEAQSLAQGEAPGDRLRVHSNFGDYWQQRAIDALYNHALRAAAGVERPLASVLENWSLAMKEYARALDFAAAANPPSGFCRVEDHAPFNDKRCCGEAIPTAMS